MKPNDSEIYNQSILIPPPPIPPTTRTHMSTGGRSFPRLNPAPPYHRIPNYDNIARDTEMAASLDFESCVPDRNNIRSLSIRHFRPSLYMIGDFYEVAGNTPL